METSQKEATAAADGRIKETQNECAAWWGQEVIRVE